MSITQLLAPRDAADFASVRLLAVDIDGTLTDGLLFDGGKDVLGWTQAYHVRDGEGMRRLAAAGVPVVPISRNRTRCARERMQGLGLPTTWVGVDDKLLALAAVLAHYDVPAAAVAYVGDGPEDVAVFAGVGVGCAVADADARALAGATFVSRLKGGRGAVGDVADQILAARQSPALGRQAVQPGGLRPRWLGPEVAAAFAAGALAGALVVLLGAGKKPSRKLVCLGLTIAALPAARISSAATGPRRAEARLPAGRGAAFLPNFEPDGPNAQKTATTGGQMHPEAQAFLATRREFRLDHLTTEQRHQHSWDLSSVVAKDTAAGLSMLWGVDQDIAGLVERLQASPASLIAASQQVEQALRGRHRILIYGCGSTGRLAKTLESLWQQFFARADGLGLRPKDPALFAHLRLAVVGDITGGDRALISSLEGFEDLPLVGELQLAALEYSPKDVLFAVSEGGETSSVLGMLAAARRQQHSSNGRTFFVYNNPAQELRSLSRSRQALDDPGITQLNLTTGPQAIAGSTRMQATSSELLVVGTILEDALTRVLSPLCSGPELAALGLSPALSLVQRLQRFADTLAAVQGQASALAQFTDAETAAYQAGRRATYRAERTLATVFTDATERSPTFRLAPIDPIDPVETPAEPGAAAEGEGRRRGWLHVASGAQHGPAAWQGLLGRDFAGLDVERFAAAVQTQVQDKDLLAAAKRSLERAGPEEGRRYDLSAASLTRPEWRLQPGDFYLGVGIDDEDWAGASVADQDAPILHQIRIGDTSTLPDVAGARGDGRTLALQVPADALNLHKNLALKLLLNAHSTAVMCKMGRVVGNTMAFVQPSNLKLIGRATFLIQSHVNDVLSGWEEQLLSYEDANSLLFEAIDVRKGRDQRTCPSEVSMAVAMGVARSRKDQPASDWDSVIDIVQEAGLETFKKQNMPASG